MNRILIVILVFVLISCQTSTEEVTSTAKSHEEIKAYLKQSQPYEMTFDARNYNETDKQILKKLVTAAEYLDTAYWLQTSKYGLKLIDSLSQIDDPYAQDLLTLVQRNGGPFELLNEYEPFIGTEEYYGGEEVYPHGMTTEQFDAYMETLSEEEKAEFMYPYTVIREDGQGGYKAVRYYEEYHLSYLVG